MAAHDTSLSYGSHLFHTWKPIELQCDDTRTFLKRLHSFVKEKADLDRSYSKSLKRLIDKFQVEDQQAESSTFDSFLASFKQLENAWASSLESNACKSEEQVDKPLQVYAETHKKQSKALEEEMQKALKSLQVYQDNLDSAKAACKKACEELQRAKENAAAGAEESGGTMTSDHNGLEPVELSPPIAASGASGASGLSSPSAGSASVATENNSKKRFGNLFKKDAGSKILNAMSNTMHNMANVSVNMPNIQLPIHRGPDFVALTEKVIANDSKYIAALKAMRAFRPQHDQHVVQLLDRCQAQEEESRRTCVDLLANYLTLQTALFSTNMDSLKAISLLLGKVNPQRDSYIFVKAHRKSGDSRPAPLPVYEMFKGHPQYVEDANEADHGLTERLNDEGRLVRKTDKRDAEEERSYARISAEQVLTLFVDKVTGYSTEKANTSSDNSSVGAEGKPLDEEERAVASRLFQTTEGRSAFATVVNMQRNRGQLHLSRSAFKSFGDLIILFLDHARTAMHVAPIQLVMILSQSLWRDAEPDEVTSRSSSVNKVFLSTIIKDHPVWREESFWEESFFDAFRSKLTNDQISIHRWHSDSEQRDAMHARKQAAFATLSTFAMNMAEFGMSRTMIDAFVEKQANMNDLDVETIEMLRSMDQLHSRKTSTDGGFIESPSSQISTFSFSPANRFKDSPSVLAIPASTSTSAPSSASTSESVSKPASASESASTSSTASLTTTDQASSPQTSSSQSINNDDTNSRTA